MGKGDKKSRRGKIIMGSYGNTRPKNKKKIIVASPQVTKEVTVKATAKPKVKEEVKETTPIIEQNVDVVAPKEALIAEPEQKEKAKKETVKKTTKKTSNKKTEK